LFACFAPDLIEFHHAGLLSLFCCRSGAKRVYGADKSDIAYHAHQVVLANGFAEKCFITQQKAEELELGEQVDVIVSEWLGSFAFFESMVESVIVARGKKLLLSLCFVLMTGPQDRLLKEQGTMLPSRVTLFGAPVFLADPHDASFWSSVEGFDFCERSCE